MKIQDFERTTATAPIQIEYFYNYADLITIRMDYTFYLAQMHSDSDYYSVVMTTEFYLFTDYNLDNFAYAAIIGEDMPVFRESQEIIQLEDGELLLPWMEPLAGIWDNLIIEIYPINLTNDINVACYIPGGSDKDDLYIFDEYIELSNPDLEFNEDIQFIRIPALQKEVAYEYYADKISPLWTDLIGSGGYNSGYTSGYNSGYDIGYDIGYEKGFIQGELNEGEQVSFTFGKAIEIISSSAADLLKVEILPNFTIGNIIFIPVVFALLGVLLKIFRR